MAWAVIASLDSPTAGVFDFTGLSLTGYETLRVVMSGITVTTDGTDVRLTFYISSSEVTSGYTWANFCITSSDSSLADSASSTTSIVLCSNNANFDTGNAATESFGGFITIPAPTSTALRKIASYETWSINPTPNSVFSSGTGHVTNAGAIDGLKIGGTSNLTAGKVRVLGLS